MKIAIVCPPWIRVPPEEYGGIEYVVWLLADGLVDRGHEVTLFSVAGSQTKGKLRWVFEGPRLDTLKKVSPIFLTEALTHSIAAYDEIRRGDFDLVSDHTWKEGLASARFLDIPVVHTIHGPMGEENKRFYSMFRGVPHIHFVTISNHQRKCLPDLNYAGTVYNGIRVRDFPFYEEKEDYLLYLGRFNPEKAPHLACEAAKKLGKRLILAGKVREPAEQKYFEEFVRPRLGPEMVFEGEVSDGRKKELLSRASALLVPIQWDEPFGIVMIEAMACGTPVVAFARGAAPELVREGETGYLAKDFKEFVEKIGKVDQIEPKSCRKWVERQFNEDVMVAKYEEVFKRVLGR